MSDRPPQDPDPRVAASTAPAPSASASNGNAPAENGGAQAMSTMHPLNSFSGMPMHMYPFPPGLVPAQPLRSKRRQVKNACTNCQKACKKCDDARPCLRCVKYGISDECIDSQRKERKKGIKRGPYKKRDGKGNSVEQADLPAPQGLPIAPGLPQASASPPLAPYMGAVPYTPAGFYGQYPGPPGPKPGETAYFPQFYLAMPPPAPGPAPGHHPHHAPHPHGHGHGHGPHGQEGEGVGMGVNVGMGQGYAPPAHAQYFPATFVTYPQAYSPYMMAPPPPPQGHPSAHGQHAGHGGNGREGMGMQGGYAYAPMYASKPPSAGGSSEGGHGNGMGRMEHGEDGK